MFWQLNRAVWGFAALLPEINCLPTTLASPGFAGEYEAMLETLYLFSTPANAAHLNESLAQLERGEVVTVDY